MRRRAIVAAIMVITAVACPARATPECMELLRTRLLPACAGAALCSPGCCEAARVPEAACPGGGPWGREYRRAALEVRQKRQECALRPEDDCPVRSPCDWSAHDPRSPCFVPACAPLFTNGSLTPDCERDVKAYCASGGTPVESCRAFKVALRTGCSRHRFTVCAAALDEGGAPVPSLRARAVRNATMVALGLRAELDAEAARWLAAGGCSESGRGAPCPRARRRQLAGGRVALEVAPPGCGGGGGGGFVAPAPAVTVALVFAPVLHLAGFLHDAAWTHMRRA